MRPRSVNLLLVSLRNVLKDCVQDGFLSALPHDVDGLSWRKTDRLERSLLAPSQIDSVCQAALKEGALKNGSAMLNGAQFVDYIRFLQFSGAREKEALKVEWSHVNFDLQILTIGAEGGTKNRKPRRIDLNADLLALLKDMYSRRDESKAWLFPSARFGARDEAAKTFRETLKLACKSAEVEFGFHDLRHYFISHAVMAGVDYLTIARWGWSSGRGSFDRQSVRAFERFPYAPDGNQAQPFSSRASVSDRVVDTAGSHDF
jgi:integrase